MSDIDDASWRTDPGLLAEFAGGQAAVDWFGYVPDFHDATLVSVELTGGQASVVLKTFRMTDKVDAEGFFVLDRHALFTILFEDVIGVELQGAVAAIVFSVRFRRLSKDLKSWAATSGPTAGSIEARFDAVFGLEGSIYADKISLILQPV